MSEQVSFGRQITLLAAKHPERVVLVHAAADGSEREVTWGELEARANQTARLLAERGVGQGSMVVVALPNSPEHYYAVIGAWKLGATVLPMRWDLPAWERDRLLALAKANVAVASWEEPPGVSMMTLADIHAGNRLESSALPDRIPNPANGIASSGSTGSPKLIIAPGPGVVTKLAMSGIKQAMGLPDDLVQLVISPLYHTNGFMSHIGLHDGHQLVVMERFDAARAVDLIERRRVQFAIMVPIMLQRIARVPGVETRDFSSIRAILYGAAPLPHWVAHAWFKLIGPEKFHISYGGTERIGQTTCTGVEWLAHEGTAGRPVASELKILDAEGRELPVGEVGEIFMKSQVTAKPFDYVGSNPPKTTPDGFATFGDMGWVDKDGYLYIADRRVDMIISGGANVFPAEVEKALSEHPKVADVVVIGLPDDEWGRRVHAIIEPAEGAAPTEAELKEHCRARLAGYKIPKTYEFIARMPRSAAGKLSRGALTAERTQGNAG
jgi:bile acid-coenzyme A ligase